MFSEKTNKSKYQNLATEELKDVIVGSYAHDIASSYSDSEVTVISEESIADSRDFINDEMAKFNEKLHVKQAEAVHEAGQLIIR